LPLLAALLLAGGCAGPRVGRTVDVRTRPTPEITAVETVGPFYEQIATSQGDLRTSIRPLIYTSIEAPRDQARLREVLWPVYADHGRGNHFTWRFLQTYGTNFDTSAEDPQRFLWILPFWFHGKSQSGQHYRALFPISGTIRDFLTYDSISFVLWPIWMTSERSGVRGRSILWPIFGRAEGEGELRWRIFPLVGYSRRAGEWERHYVLWPFWSYARYLREPVAGYEWALLPIYGRAERVSESSRYYIPPLFQFTYGKGRNAGQRRILAPWPLVRIEDSRATHKRHYWPFYATTWSEGNRNTYAAWPFYRHTWNRHGNYEAEAWSLAPLYHRSVERRRYPAPEDPANAAPGDTDAAPFDPVSSYTRLWPLYSRTYREQQTFVRIPDLSFQRRTGALERNLLQMFTLYTRGEDAERDRVEHSFLWGFYHSLREGELERQWRLWPFYSRQSSAHAGSASWSLLGGLLGRERQGKAHNWRYLWFFGGGRPDKEMAEP